MAENTTILFPENQTNVEFENKATYGEAFEKLSQESKGLLLSLPREKGWINPYIYLYQDIWYIPVRVQAICSFQKHFKTKDSYIIIASIPRSGTTWLKALTFAIVNRNHFSPSSQNLHPLLASNAHDLVPHLEFNLYENKQIPDPSNLPEPRLFGTHIPFHSLPDSIKSKCKIIYIYRNPFDHFVCSWFFFNKVQQPSLPKLSREEASERYSKGIIEFGPFWTQILSYWRESKESVPNKFLFLKYEDLKGNIKFYLKRIAEFLNCPFDLEEEDNGVIEKIIELCDFEKTKELELNKRGKFLQRYEYKDFFRKGEVGDWVNHFSPWMEERLSKLIEEKLAGSCFSF